MADIEALLVEREGYKRRGLKDRVAQVDAAIETLGVSVSDDPEPEQTEEPDDAPAGDELETTDGKPNKRRK